MQTQKYNDNSKLNSQNRWKVNPMSQGCFASLLWVFSKIIMNLSGEKQEIDASIDKKWKKDWSKSQKDPTAIHDETCMGSVA